MPWVAPGSGVAVVMLKGGLLEIIVRLNALNALFLAVSVTCTVKLNEPTAVGVPERGASGCGERLRVRTACRAAWQRRPCRDA